MLVCVILIGPCPSSLLAFSQDTQYDQEYDDQEPDTYGERIFEGNKGFLYYNPNIGEEKEKGDDFTILSPFQRIERPAVRQKPQKARPLPPMVKKQPTTVPLPPPARVVREISYTEELERALIEEKDKNDRLREDIEALKSRIESLLMQLSTATQKIMGLQTGPTVSGRITQTYQVKEGESLWSIAAKKEIYGNPRKWLLLYHANRDQIYDPGLIFPDMVLLVPRVDEYRSP